jgi:alkylhydroperoxidase family enzyme
LTRYDDLIDRLRDAALPGRPVPAGMEGYLEKVRLHAYRVTDDDVHALRAAHSEDAIFAATVAVAVAAGLERLDAALDALGSPR